MKLTVNDQRVDLVNVVGNVVVMEDFMCSLNVAHAVVENEQHGRIIPQTVHVMAMVDKHQRKSAMIVTVVVINK